MIQSAAINKQAGMTHNRIDQILVSLTSRRINRCRQNHAAYVIKNGEVVLSYGANKYTMMGRTVHAEMAALRNLPSRRHMMPQKVDMMVIRITSTGKLGMSMPCIRCVIDMHEMAPVIGYRIDKVYYSTQSGDIECQKLRHLIEQGKFHVSAYYRNFKHPWLVGEIKK